jgi:hypothetical protein
MAQRIEGRPCARGHGYADGVDDTPTSRRFEPVTALLISVMLAGMFNVVGSALSTLTLPSTISSLNEEFEPYDMRELVVSEFLWAAVPAFAVGLPMAVVGLQVLRRSGRLKGVRWQTVVAGVALSVVLAWGLALLFIGLRLAIRQLT